MDTIKVLCELYFSIEDINTKDLIVKKIQSICSQKLTGWNEGFEPYNPNNITCKSSDNSSIEFDELATRLQNRSIN